MHSIGGAWARIAAVAAAALALALLAGRAVERVRPELTRLPESPFRAMAGARVDASQQLTPEVVDYAVRLSHRFGIDALVNLSGGWSGGGLEEQLAAASRHGGRVKVFMNLDPDGCCGPAWVEREADRLARGKAAGAIGLALLARPGAAPAPGELPEALWLACERLGLRVALRAGAAALAEAHPRIAVVGLALGGMGDDPAAAAAALARLPNLALELGGAAPALSRHPEAARALLAAHPDRILFGTGIRYEDRPPYHELLLDGGPPARDEADLRRFFLGLYRFLETRDRSIPGLVEGAPSLDGLGLPRDVLTQVYRRNGRRLLELAAREP